MTITTEDYTYDKNKNDKTPKTKEQAEVRLTELTDEKMKDDKSLNYREAMEEVMDDEKNAAIVKLCE